MTVIQYPICVRLNSFKVANKCDGASTYVCKVHISSLFFLSRIERSVKRLRMKQSLCICRLADVR